MGRVGDTVVALDRTKDGNEEDRNRVENKKMKRKKMERTVVVRMTTTTSPAMRECRL